MIVFPNAKINLGLNVINRRPDGYHDLDMVMMPIGWHDILEVVPAQSAETTLSISGRPVDCPMERNLVYKAWARLGEYVGANLPAVEIHLHKIIPDGAGLGGGSADAAFMLKALNQLFALDLADSALAEVAASIGADCPFFIYNKPMHCTATGTTMTPIAVDLGAACHIVIAKPREVSVSTAEAYRGVTPRVPTLSTADIVGHLQPAEWRGKLTNMFEPHIFAAHPRIADIKQRLYDMGAVYASMSGSGSAVFGLFDGREKAAEAANALDADNCDTFF